MLCDFNYLKIRTHNCFLPKKYIFSTINKKINNCFYQKSIEYDMNSVYAKSKSDLSRFYHSFTIFTRFNKY